MVVLLVILDEFLFVSFCYLSSHVVCRKMFTYVIKYFMTFVENIFPMTLFLMTL